MASKNNTNSDSNTFLLFWLDSSVNETEDNQAIQKTLREIINHFKAFADLDKCRRYILSLSPQDRAILIVSGRFGRELVPQIHSYPQVLAIYVYCFDKEANEKWSKQFPKIKNVVVQPKDLIAEIGAYGKPPPAEHIEPLLFSVSAEENGSEQSTTDLNGHFVHSLLLIDVLIRMKSIETDKQELIKRCRQQYEDDGIELDNIRRFERKYVPTDALTWYTEESFLYKMLNKALRTQDIDLLFLFRFAIGDIYRQLKSHQCQSPVHVYRGQLMSKTELETLKKSANQLISINSFFSCSTKPEKAREFLERKPISGDTQRVFFEIYANPRVATSKPFADISQMSVIKDEEEILFMMGSVFRLSSIFPDKSNSSTWVIRAELCGDENHDLKKLFEYMKEKYGGGNDEDVSLRSFGEVLRKMGKFDLAEKMFHRLLKETPNGDPQLFSLYYSLGQVAYEKAEYDPSLEWFKKSLSIIMDLDSSDYVNIAAVYGWIGNAYLGKDDLDTAENFYYKAIKLFQQAHQEDHEDLAYLYNSIALIYNQKKQYPEALDYYKKSLHIREKHLPANHPEIAVSHNNIGCVYLSLEKYDSALKHHTQALEIRTKSLPPKHPDIAQSFANLGQVNEAKREWQTALVHYQKAASIYQSTLPPQHPTVSQIKSDLERISSKMKK
ncbi:unnamed protein product [Adineta ricciae]|uniref:ADP ribosyltransferase domain-containing protein n=1 Tax=Adineta ricciae TaxID=249248 RepID=A0A814L022_ADIRI|nr:unnamed protein product [Adineta ricciae]